MNSDHGAHISARALCAIFVAALALRGMFVATHSDAILFPDAQEYDYLARRVAAGEPYQERESRRASRAPGYPVFLAACYKAGLDRPRAVYAVQAAADAAMCALLALLAARLFSRAVALIAGWSAVVYPFFIYFTGLLLGETLFTLGLVAYIAALAVMLRRRTWRTAVLAGLLAGLLTLLRSSFMLFPIFVLPILALMTQRERLPRAAALAGVMLLTMGLALTPWTVRNYRMFGRVIPTTLQVGESLYEAFSPYADGGPAMDRIDWVKERGGVMMGELDNNDFFKKAALDWIRAHPGKAAALTVEKFRRFWNIVPNFAATASPLYSAVSILATVPVYLLALVGLIRGRKDGWLLLIAPVLYFTLLHMVFVGSVRYRTPIMPFVLIFAAAGAVALWDWAVRARRPAEEGAHG